MTQIARWEASTALAEVSARQHQWSHQGPEIEGQAEPAGADLHPDGRHAGLHGLVVGVWPGESEGRVIVGEESWLA